jgi:hypothetical protein
LDFPAAFAFDQRRLAWCAFPTALLAFQPPIAMPAETHFQPPVQFAKACLDGRIDFPVIPLPVALNFQLKERGLCENPGRDDVAPLAYHFDVEVMQPCVRIIFPSPFKKGNGFQRLFDFDDPFSPPKTPPEIGAMVNHLGADHGENGLQRLAVRAVQGAFAKHIEPAPAALDGRVEHDDGVASSGKVVVFADRRQQTAVRNVLGIKHRVRVEGDGFAGVVF